ncbi:MAG: carboxypeptidase [Leptospiraceae bacterium]|nr:carboxypeptidase [Leptospiraceae bacterium]
MLRGLRRVNRYENRLFKLTKLGGKKVRLNQLGYSRKTKEGFRFPIYGLEIGKPSSFEKNVVGFVAGVHGLETIGIRILFDFLEHLLYPGNKSFLPELHSGKLGIACIPILNPGGVVLKSRANPAGVDLMRNSNVEAEKPVKFFGGQSFSAKLPYFRGKAIQPENRVLLNFVKKYFYPLNQNIIPVLDIHSGFGTIDNVWWPYAYTKDKCPDDSLYSKLSKILKDDCYHLHLKYGPQSEIYTTHGDIWDKIYLEFQEKSNNSSKLLPWTLEVGTWSDIKSDPWKIFRKRGIFNPSQMNKHTYIKNYRYFLRDFA